MTATQPPARPPALPEIPGYRLDPPAGPGSGPLGPHGTVVDAVRRSDGAAVQVELLSLPTGSADRFREEAGALLELPRTPQLVAVLDLGVLTEDHGGSVTAYLVTERAVRSLADRLSTDGPLTDAAAVAAATDAALALVALHGAGVLHGGLTPAAVVELANGRFAVGGVALPVLEESHDGAARPPEVRRGGDWSVAGDLWALGSVLRELTGTRRLSGPLAGLLDDLLAPDPADRPRDAAEVVDRLRAVSVPDPLETAGPAAPVPTVAAGRPLGSNYLLVAPIGRGATGQVWRGTRRNDGTAVAVKVLRSELAEDPEVVTRFVAERTTLTGLASPYLVQVLDLVAESGTLAIVMALVDGADLRHSLAAGRLTTAEAFRVLAHVAEGMAAVHAAGVVHRDVKPENVLVGRDGEGQVHAWLTDFGVAGAVAPGPGRRLTRASRLVGTPEYVAPELAAGRPATGAADVYALGVLAYETLSGRRPFDAEHPAALLRAHLEDVPQRPAGMAEEVWGVVSPCLAKDPDDRPGAARAAAAFTALSARADDAVTLGALPATSGATPPPYLSPAVAGEPHPAALPTSDATRPADPAPAAPVEPGRRRWPWVAAIAVLAVLGIAAGAWVGRPDPAPAKPGPEASSFQGTVAVPVVVDSPRKGDVRLRFPGGAALPGVQSFFVVRDGTVAAQGLGPGDEDWTAADLDPGTQHCWAVFAVVESARPVPTPSTSVKPICQQADGRSQ